MRIVAGTYRGRRLGAPPGRGTRPTTDRVRESLMSSIASARGGFEGAIVWDAFAGSGALGFESLSRGASFVCLTDNDTSAIACLRKNAEALGVDEDCCRILKRDCFRSLAPVIFDSAAYDLVFFDPPYAVSAESVTDICVRMAKARLLKEGAIISYEHAKSAETLEGQGEAFFAGNTLSLSLETRKMFGDTVVDLFRYQRRLQ